MMFVKNAERRRVHLSERRVLHELHEPNDARHRPGGGDLDEKGHVTTVPPARARRPNAGPRSGGVGAGARSLRNGFGVLDAFER